MIFQQSIRGLGVGFRHKLNPNTTLFPSMKLWLRPDELTTAGVLASWLDKSGQANNATQATNPPSVVLNQQNGFSTVRFDGTNDFLSTNVAIGNVHTFFVLYKSTGSGIGSALVSGAGGAGVDDWQLQKGGGGGPIQIGGLFTGAFDTASFRLITVYSTSAIDTKLHVNGSINADFQGNANLPTGTTITNIGKRYDNVFLNGDISEILAFNTVLSQTKRQEIEGCLMWKYRLEANLPVAHPYKTFDP